MPAKGYGQDTRFDKVELKFNDGTIWCEHLDGMGLCEDEKSKEWVM